MRKIEKVIVVALGLLIGATVCRASTIAETLAAEDKALAARNAPAAVVRLDAPAQLSVIGVYGVNAELLTDINYNGVRSQRLRSGDRVGTACQVKSIVGSCVVLEVAASASKRLGKKTPTNADQCPRACWTAPAAITQTQGTGLPPGMPVSPPVLVPSPLARPLPGPAFPPPVTASANAP